MPDYAALGDEELAPLAEHAEAGAEVLQRRAKELQQQAEQLRRLAGEVHARGIAEKLAALMKQPEQQIDLLKAGLLIAQLDEADLDADVYLKQVERMAAEIKRKLPDKADERRDCWRWATSSSAKTAFTAAAPISITAPTATSTG